MKHLSLILFSILIFSFKSNYAQERPEKPKKCALRVNFGSPGSGIDLKKYEEVKKILDDKKLKYIEVPCGMEGEVYFCLQLTELKKKKKKELVKQLKSTIKDGQLVSLSENYVNSSN